MSDFKKFVIIPENEYKSLISKVGRLSTQSTLITESTPIEPQQDNQKLVSNPESQILNEKLESGEEIKKKEEEVEEKEEEVKAEPEEKKIRPKKSGGENDSVIPQKRRKVAPTPRKSIENGTSTHGQHNFAILISTFEEYFAKKYHDRIVRLLRRLFATDQLKVKLSGEKEVKSVNLGSSSFTLLRFIDLIELCALSRKKPEKTAEYASFLNFIQKNEIPKTLLYNPHLKSPESPSNKVQKKYTRVPQKSVGVKWYTSERDVSDSD